MAKENGVFMGQVGVGEVRKKKKKMAPPPSLPRIGELCVLTLLPPASSPTPASSGGVANSFSKSM